jgi:hypothetical protein
MFYGTQWFITAIKTARNWTCPGHNIEYIRNEVFWDVTSCDSCKNATFRMNESPPSPGWEESSSVVPSSLILSTLIMEAIRSCVTSVLTRATRCHIPEYGFFIVTAEKNLNLTSNTLVELVFLFVLNISLAAFRPDQPRLEGQ